MAKHLPLQTQENHDYAVKAGIRNCFLKFSFSFIILLATLSSSAQLSLLSESFEAAVPPAGWANLKTGSANFWSSGFYGGFATGIDGHTGTGYAEYVYNSSNAADAWLITPGIAMTAGNTYSISYWERSSGVTYPEKLKVTVGNAQTIAAQTTTLQTINPVTNVSYTKQTISYSPVSNGTYYFAWNCFSAANQFYLDIDDVSITCTTCPYIDVAPATLATFTSTAGVPSAQQAYTVTGFGLSNNITVTAPAGFQISLTGGGGFVSSSPITLTQTGGSVPATNIYVRSNSASATTFTGTLSNVSAGATTRNITLNGNNTPCVTATNTLTLTTAGTTTWSTSAASWSLAHIPRPCENVVINYNESTTGADTRTIYIDIPVNVNDLTISCAPGANGQKTMDVYSDYPLVIAGNLNISSAGGNSTATEAFLGSTSAITVLGNATIGGTAGTQRLSSFGTWSGTPTFTFKGNVTYNSRGYNYSSGTWIYDGTGAQSITHNSTVYSNAVAFENLKVGYMNTPAVAVAGSTSNTVYVNGGNLTVSPAATLQIPVGYKLNQYTAGAGSINLNSASNLQLAGTTGGETGSNFPLSFGSYNFNKTSTVEYNGIANQAIYSGPVYGNLTLTNNAIKYTRATLYVDGNLTVNNTASFNCYDISTGTGYTTVFSGSTLLNNGAIVGNATASRFGFYGTGAQTYSGSGTFGTTAIPFQAGGIDISNSNNVTLNAPIKTSRLNLFNGSFINSNQFTIGNGTFGLVQVGGVTGVNAGALSGTPAFNTGTNYIVRYDDANAVTTGSEIPTGRSVTTVYSNNPNGVTLAGGDLSITTDFQLLLDTFDIASNKLSIGGTITRTSGNINGANGTLEMNGTAAQSIPASTFQSNNLKNLIISNTNTVTGVTLAGTLDVYRSVTFGAGGRILTTGDFLTFKSALTETAWLGQLSGTNSIVGRATVERYIPLHAKAWQSLSTPITAASTQTVNQAWQENSVAVNDNLTPGYGTQLTSNRVGAATRPSPGFDVYTPSGPSIKIFNHATGGYIGLNRTDTAISNPKGYMVLVRGNRTVTTSGGAATATIMRTKGTLHTPANPPVTMNITTPGFESIGNPYASAIDYSQLTISGGVQTGFFYVWDPKLTIGPSSAYGLGGLQSFSWNGSSWDVTPGGGSYSGSNRYIESGQAFFVNAPSAAGSVAFSEACKVTGSNNVNRVPVSTIKQLRTNLSVIISGSKVLLDGNMVQFDRSWLNRVDINDGIKMNNSGENFGIDRDGKTLSVERRAPIQLTDTLFYKMGMVRVQQYELEFIPANLQEPGLEAFLEDNYLHTSIAINITTTSSVLFNIVNVPGSYAADRFRLVFRQKKKQTLPVAIPTADAGKSNAILTNTGKGITAGIDAAKQPSVTVYPNPVVNKTVQVQFTNLEAGTYNIELTNKSGQLVYSTGMQIATVDVVKSLQLDKTVAAGTYQLAITAINGYKSTQQVVIQ